MTIYKNILDSIEESYNETLKTTTDDGIDVSVTLSQCLCTISLASDLNVDVSSRAKNIEDLLNAGQSLARYSVKKNKFILDTTMWVEVRPTKTSLNEILNVTLAQYNANKLMIEGGVLSEW